MPLFDTHAHYNLPPLYENWREHWLKAQQQGVKKSIVVGTNTAPSKKAVEISSLADGLYAAVGKHPDAYRQAVKTQLQDHQSHQGVFEDIDKDIAFFKKLIYTQ